MKSEEQINREWADSMLNECIDAMEEGKIAVTPGSLSQYFEENYELPYTPQQAWNWLAQQGWYTERH